jgi:hypothetical protein
MLHNKFWQAFFALAPLACIFIALVGYFLFILTVVSRGPGWEMDPDHTPLAFFGGLGIFLLLIFLAVILSLASLVFYIIHATQNPNLTQNNLLLIWILLFVFANGLGQLIYWIIEILNKRQQPVKM